MPAFLMTLLLPVRIEPILIDLLVSLRTNDAYLIILVAILPLRVADRMNMQSGRARLSRQLAQSLGKFLLRVVVKIVLGTEEYYSSS